MKHITRYIFDALKNSGELSGDDFLADDGAEESFVYYDGDGGDFYRISVERANVEVGS